MCLVELVLNNAHMFKYAGTLNLVKQGLTSGMSKTLLTHKKRTKIKSPRCNKKLAQHIMLNVCKC